jgi:hypothetical protein
VSTELACERSDFRPARAGRGGHPAAAELWGVIIFPVAARGVVRIEQGVPG